MARPRRIDLDLVAQARQVTRQTQNLGVYRQAMSILLPADLSASLEQTARVLGVGRATVHRLQAQFRHQRQRSGPPRRTWGGRRRALLSSREEENFLKPWGYVLSGEVSWVGEDCPDTGVIIIENNVVRTEVTDDERQYEEDDEE